MVRGWVLNAEEPSPSHKGGGVRGLLREIFQKLDCLRVDKAIFKPISVILQAFFFLSFSGGRGSISAAWGRQYSFMGHSLSSSDSRRGQFLAKECALYWLTTIV